MKRVALFSVLVLLTCGFLVRTVASSTDSVMERLGVATDSAKNYIWYSLSSGIFSYPSLPQLKEVAKSERASIVASIGTFARAYTESEDFSRRYAEYREQHKPTPPEPPQPMDKQRQAQRESMEKSIRETEESMKSLPQETRESMQQVVEMLKEQLKELDDPNNPLFSKDMEELLNQGYEAQLRDHQREVSDWERTYPKDPKKMIQGRLEEFLRASQDIDFQAELKPGRDGKMIFSNPVYEQKPGEWKLGFRVGQETVEAARIFAQKWLEDLKQTQ